MLETSNDTVGDSPFHAGEQELQARIGKREHLERIGRRVIRKHMPDQHRTFFEKLPFLIIGGVDAAGWPWASLASGQPGFVRSPDARTLQIDGHFAAGDPLCGAFQLGARVGLLGMEPATRRRNRMNGHLVEVTGTGFSVVVDQSFGNCPQYIQTRSVKFIRDPGQRSVGRGSSKFAGLNKPARDLIRSANTFFVASFARSDTENGIGDVDVSHRGGRAGFVKVDGDTLTIPDYPGNQHFNTLGNFLVNPKAGLTFVDFETGDMLALTGTVELVWESNAEVEAFKGAERAWRFTLDHGVHLEDALPFRAPTEEYSANSLLTGDWQQTAATLAAQAKRDAWRPYRLTRVEDESADIRSFYLQPADGDGVLPFDAGQFLTIRTQLDEAAEPVVRIYTVSSAPGDEGYRISVKREPHGRVSRHLHDSLKPGDVIEAKAPSGGFSIDASETRPAVLVAGGVGITPMISMARHVATEGLRTRHLRPLTILHAAKTIEQRAFAANFEDLQQVTGGKIRYFSFISQPTPEEKPGVDFNGSGRITAAALRQVLALDDYDFYLCGPAPFMQALYDALRSLGVRNARIFAEAFGPASLQRKPDIGGAVFEPQEEAEAAIIAFTQSGFEQGWSRGDATILEMAEQHGLSPAYGCRAGSCGSCAVKLNAGRVAYRFEPTAAMAEDEVLICCAVPAKGTEVVDVEL
ncbi:MAG: pyridoxamine 5'-phosphate oxidase family protein [Hyphomicrobiaceae bacterium]